MSVMLYPCMLCVACLTVFVNCLVKQFAIVFRPYPEAVQRDKPTLVAHADLHPVCGNLLE